MSDPAPGVLATDPTFRRQVIARNAFSARARVVGSDARTVARVTRTVVAHDRTRALGRQVVYVPAGVRAGWRYYRLNHTSARYIAQIDAAWAAGNTELAMELTARMEAERGRRWSRVTDVLKLGVQLVKMLPWLLLIAVFGLLGLGVLLAVGGHDSALVLAPFRWIVAIVAFGLALFTLTAAFLPWAVLGVVVLALWAAGRRAGDVPEFLAPAAEREVATREVIPDERAILAALRDLNLAPLNRKFKEGWLPRWPLATGRDGNGYRTQLELPPGVTVDMINQRKDVLAHNLVRLPVEVWPTEPQKQPGVLDLWVADQGLLSGPVAPYPLLKDGTCDYFKGVPVGTDQRGQTLTGRLMACNYAIGGTMGSGKSSLVINLVTGAALDPLVDIDVYVMAYNVDYDPFKGRLSMLVKGDEDEHITTAMDGLRELREEVTKRGKLLDTLGGEETKVTRALAKQDRRLRPRLVVFDECFPAGTMIGNKRIENIRVGDRVPSWNEETRQPCEGTVTGLFSKTPTALVRIVWHNGSTLVCTPNHPLMTRDGWQSAGSLTASSKVLSYEQDDSSAARKSAVHKMRRGLFASARAASVLAQDEPRLLLEEVQQRRAGLSPDRSVTDDPRWPGQPECSYDGQEPHARPRHQGKGHSDTAGDGSRTFRTWWERARTDRASALARGGPGGLAHGSGRGNQTAKDQRWVPVSLQAGHRTPDAETGHRNRRIISLRNSAPRAGSQEREIAQWIGVDSVEVLEQGSDGQFGGLCPEGVVYNFEVEGTHTYQVAGGIVAHNCQELFRHEKYGDQAKSLAIKVMTKARKCGITLVWVTPEPSADSLPRELAKIVSHGVCFAIGDYQGNDAILGTGAYKRGISAVDLDPQENIGTAMAFGFAGRPGLLRSFYIRKDASTDELTPIARRSMDPWKGARPVEPHEMRDLVLDVHEALGSDDTLKATRLVARLLDLAPNYRPYQSLNATQLAEWLTRDGVPVKDLNGVLTVRARLVLEELNRRQGAG